MWKEIFLKQTDDQILGLNRRNQDYVRPYNSTSAKAIADNKLLTKRVLAKVGIKTPEVYKVVRTKKQLDHLDWTSLPNSFVIKPNQGTGGNGIIIFYGKRKNKLEWIRPSGQIMDQHDLILHMENILQGRFSMGGKQDVVILEERVKIDALLKDYSYRGVPDVRVIIFNHVPVMAMLRLPTRKSNGAANMHAGGIACGIDIASGLTTTAVAPDYSSPTDYTFKLVDSTLDLEKNLPLSGIPIPYWDEILEISSKCQKITGLGYLGVDMVIDRDKGPLVLELNARPGLAIQHANMSGLRTRLERIQGLKVKSIKHGIRVAKSLFGGEIEEEIEAISGKQVVSLIEKVTLYHKKKLQQAKSGRIKKPNQQKKEYVSAMLDTGITTSRIDSNLAARIGFSEAVSEFKKLEIPRNFDSIRDAQDYIHDNHEQLLVHSDIIRYAVIQEEGKIRVKPVIRSSLKIAGENKEIETVLSAQIDMLYPILIGRKELKNYLIDAGRTFVK